jgi:hypothetical protein
MFSPPSTKKPTPFALIKKLLIFVAIQAMLGNNKK